jgi:hypothetical protein
LCPSLGLRAAAVDPGHHFPVFVTTVELQFAQLVPETSSCGPPRQIRISPTDEPADISDILPHSLFCACDLLWMPGSPCALQPGGDRKTPRSDGEFRHGAVDR